MRKRILAAFMAVCIGVTALPGNQLVYGAMEQEMAKEETAITSQEGEDSGSSQGTEPGYETVSEVAETESEEPAASEQTEVDASETEGSSETPGTESVTSEASETEETAQEEIRLNYLLVESAYIETPGTQNIVASIGGEKGQISDVDMTYENIITGERFTVAANAIVEDMALFTLEYTAEDQSGQYEIVELSCRQEGKDYRFDIRKMDMKAVFGVNQEVDAQPDDVLVDENLLSEVEANVVHVDENGTILSENTVTGQSSQKIAEDISVQSQMRKTGNLTVVLDAGHDDTHAGARGNGAAEETLTLKIAQYCKAELETYSGVSVYMVRETGACPYSGSGWISSGTCNEKRVQFAASVGANVYVSFHLNASTSGSASGVGVYYPNTNYRYDLSEIGRDLATRIYWKLVALGLGTWGNGLLTQNSADYKYDDGSVADYLAVIRNCKKAGIPAVLIEHAFLSNSGDYNGFLSSDEKLQQLGIADASAIAEKYGLYKKGLNSQLTAVLSQSGGKIYLEWSVADGAESYEIYRSTSKDGGFERIQTVSDRLNYTDADISIGTIYYYKVKPVFADGRATEESAVVSGRALKQVKKLAAKSTESKKIVLTWNAVAGAEGYLILRKNDSGKYEQVAQVTGKKNTSYTDTVSSDNVTYSYKVQAYQVYNNRQGVGTASEEKKGMTIAVPQGIRVASLDETLLEISWGKVSGASYYEIYRSTSENGTYKKVADTASGSENVYEDETVKKGKAYFYKIQTVGTDGENAIYSGLSGAAGGKTIARTTITSVKSVNEKTLQISWKKIADAYGYQVKRSNKKDGTYKVIKQITSGSTVSYKDTKRKPGKTYYYTVEVLNKTGETIGYSGDSAVKSGKTAPLTTIEAVTSNEDGQLEIVWEEVEDAYGYIVKRSTKKNSDYKKLATVKNDTSYIDEEVKEGTTYYYKIETINKVGGVRGYSGDCEAVSGKLLQTAEINALKAVDSKTIRLGWKAVSGVSGYSVYRSTKKNGTYDKIATVKGKGNVSYDDKTVKTGKTYYYKVQTYKKNGDINSVSKLSAAKKAWTVDKVVITEVLGTSGGKITLNWESVKNAGSYTIYRRVGNSGSYKKLAKAEADATKYVDKDIKTGQVYAYRIAANTVLMGKTEGRGDYSLTVTVPVLAKSGISAGVLLENNTLSLSWTPVANATGYELACSLQQDANFVTLAQTAAASYDHANLQQGAAYYYKVRACRVLENGSTVYGPWSAVSEQVAGHTIMGDSAVTVEQMTNYYQARYIYPAEVYTEKGAADATTFFTILKEEAAAEGVKTEVLFAQVILETGGLSFAGDVAAWQCNFGGIGATGNGVAGEVFADVRTGLRAQAQHLKAYASTEDLKQDCVDPRFSLVKRGTAPYIEWLAIPKNPNGGGWAADADYAVKLLSIIQNL